MTAAPSTLLGNRQFTQQDLDDLNLQLKADIAGRVEPVAHLLHEREEVEEMVAQETLAKFYRSRVAAWQSPGRSGPRLKPTDLAAILDRLRIDEKHAAFLGQVTEQAVRGWLTGRRQIPGPADQLYWLLARYPALVGDLERRSRGED